MALFRGLAQLTEAELLKLTSSGDFSVDDLSSDVSGKTQQAWRVVDGAALIPKFALDWGNLTYSPRIRQVAPQPSAPSYSFNGNLRPYQEPAVQEAVQLLRKHEGLTLLADCGTGKTVMGIKIASMVSSNTIILVDQIDIAEQWQSQLKVFLPKATVAILGGGHNEVNKAIKADFRIVVAQSLWRKEWANDPLVCELLICDEAHVFATPRFFDSLTNISFRYSLGLTATPDRKDGMEWVFQKCLGTKTLQVAGKAMTCKVIQVFSTNFAPDVDENDYGMAWCTTYQGMTWMAKCVNCPKFGAFPSCGNLPTTKTLAGPPKVAWNTKKKSTTNLFIDACSTPEYLRWLHSQTVNLFKKGRNIMVFAAYKGILENLYSAGVASLGVENCGWFVGKAGKKDPSRSDELNKPVTYATYGVARKALDIPKKDCAIFATPMSDIKQIKGRIERVLPNKPQPLILDPVHRNIPMLYGMSLARRRTYKQYGCPIVSTNI